MLLANYFLRKHGRPKLTLSNDVQKILLAYDFPGNVRELENAMQRTAILCHDKSVQKEHLPPEMQHQPISQKSWGTFADEKQRLLQEFEKSILLMR